MSAAPALDAFVPEYRHGSARGDAELAAAARGYVTALRGHLEARHREGATGQEVNEANSDGFDRLVRRLYQLAEGRFFAEGGDLGERACVLAVGGYARRELSIGSDLDLLVLHEGEENPLAAFVAERIQYVLWDAGVDVALAVRTVRQTLDLARSDDSAFTSVLMARFLSGDARLLHELNAGVRGELLADPEAFVRGQEQAMAARHAKFGESLYLLQPNLKEGAGGLRDYHTACWVARAVDPLVVSRADFLHAGLLSESEMADYEAALQFLWRLRNELHLLQSRKTDQMSFELQELLAKGFGYAETADDTELPVERFMRDYYRHARAIQTFSEIVIEQCHARARPPAPRPEPVVVEDGFRLVGDHLEIPHAAHLRERPVRLLTAFAVAQDHDVPLSRTARRMLRENLSLVDESFRHDPEAAATLMRVLGSRFRVMRTLMAMNEVGLLGRFLPEWDHVVCRWQHVVYHTYTVDVHSIFLVEALRRLWRGQFEDELPDLTELVRAVPDLPGLFLGCLLHDIGKGYGGDHSGKGARLAEALLRRLGVPRARRRRIVFVVRHHLLMSHVSQRRDLADPKVIVDFARIVGDRENLHNLYLATYADMRASSDSAFTEWRAELMRELFERTSEFLESGEDDPRRAAEQVEARVRTRVQQARRELRRGVGETALIESYFEMMPRRYFVSHTPRQIARHAMVVFGFEGERPFASAVREMRGGFSEFILVARDVHGLYSDVAGSLTAAGINILGSNVYTTRTGLALEVYRVTTPSGGEEEKREAWTTLETILGRVLGEGEPVAALLARRGPRVGRRQLRSHTPASVSVRNDVSDFYTVVDVTADDRPGLLYELARTMAEHDLEIFVSKATTVLDQVADTFYVKAADGKRVLDPARLRALRAALLAVVSEEPAEARRAE
jgi:[protein-PII] uridylyltransferase